MAKVIVWEGQRPPRPVFRREYTDSNHPGKTVVLHLRAHDAIDSGKLQDLAARNSELFVTGNKIEGSPPMDFPCEGEPIQLSESLVTTAAALTVAQHPPEKADRYTFNEVIGLSVLWPEAWRAMQRDLRNLMVHASPDPPDVKMESELSEDGANPTIAGKKTAPPPTTT